MRAIIFDLDGTLIDSAPDLRAALNRLLADRGLSPLGESAVRAMLGDGAKALVERAFAVHGRAAGPAELSDFLEDYEAHAAVATAPYPGMIDVLEVLRDSGHKLGVCTNKPDRAARNVLAALGLKGFFAAVIGGDVHHRKPDSRHLAAAVAALGGGAAVMIGDHANDEAAAAGLPIPFIHAAWGYGAVAHAPVAHGARELPDLIATL